MNAGRLGSLLNLTPATNLKDREDLGVALKVESGLDQSDSAYHSFLYDYDANVILTSIGWLRKLLPPCIKTSMSLVVDAKLKPQLELAE